MFPFDAWVSIQPGEQNAHRPVVVDLADDLAEHAGEILHLQIGQAAEGIRLPLELV